MAAVLLAHVCEIFVQNSKKLFPMQHAASPIESSLSSLNDDIDFDRRFGGILSFNRRFDAADVEPGSGARRSARRYKNRRRARAKSAHICRRGHVCRVELIFNAVRAGLRACLYAGTLPFFRLC